MKELHKITRPGAGLGHGGIVRLRQGVEAAPGVPADAQGGKRHRRQKLGCLGQRRRRRHHFYGQPDGSG